MKMLGALPRKLEPQAFRMVKLPLWRFSECFRGRNDLFGHLLISCLEPDVNGAAIGELGFAEEKTHRAPGRGLGGSCLALHAAGRGQPGGRVRTGWKLPCVPTASGAHLVPLAHVFSSANPTIE